MESTTRSTRTGTTETSLWAVGLATFAGMLLLTIGIFQILEGIVAVINDELLVSVGGYAYALDSTAWGWIHMLLGAIGVVTGAFILRGAMWARSVGILLASLSAVANFLWLPYYPLWAVIVIALAVAVIWALAVYDPDPR
jgi:hypothetical protein